MAFRRNTNNNNGRGLTVTPVSISDERGRTVIFEFEKTIFDQNLKLVCDLGTENTWKC